MTPDQLLAQDREAIARLIYNIFGLAHFIDYRDNIVWKKSDALTDQILALVASRLEEKGSETPWRPIDSAPRDGTLVFLICAEACSPTPFEGWWAEDGQWNVAGAGWVHYALSEHKQSGGVRKWFPTHWISKDDLAAPPASRLAPAQEQQVQMNDDQIKYMVDRFLGWRLPENFSPDNGVSFKPTFNDHLPNPMKHEPTGTNLFDATQADAMVRYMVEGLLAPAPIEEPVELGGFIGDIFFGDRDHTTLGTHRWTGSAWEQLPSDAEALTDLLAEARAKLDTWKARAQAAEQSLIILAANSRLGHLGAQMKQIAALRKVLLRAEYHVACRVQETRSGEAADALNDIRAALAQPTAGEEEEA